jgi:hypothetical protein
MSLLAACVQPNTGNYYFGAAGGSSGVSSITSTGSGLAVATDLSSIVTISGTGVLSLTAAASANGLSVTPTSGNVVVSYTAPPSVLPKVVNVLDALSGFPTSTIQPTNLVQLFQWNADGGAGATLSTRTEVVLGAVPELTGICTNASFAPANGGGSISGIPVMTLLVAPVAGGPGVAGPGAYQSFSAAFGTVSGQIDFPNHLYFVADAPAGTAAWGLYMRNDSTGVIPTYAAITFSNVAGVSWNVQTLNTLV